MAEGHGRCEHGRYPAANCKKCQRAAAARGVPASAAPVEGPVDPLETAIAPPAIQLDANGKFIPPATGLWDNPKPMGQAEYALAIARWKAHMGTPDAPNGRSVGAPVDTMTADPAPHDSAVAGAPPLTTTPQGPHEGYGTHAGNPAVDRVQTVPHPLLTGGPFEMGPIDARGPVLPARPLSVDDVMNALTADERRVAEESYRRFGVPGPIRDFNDAARQQAEQARVEQELTAPSLADLAQSRANPTRPNPLGPIVASEVAMAPRTLELPLDGHKLGGQALVDRCEALGVLYQVKMVGARRVVSYFGTPGAMLSLLDWMTAKGLNPEKVGEVELSPSLHQHRPPKTKEVTPGPAWGRDLSVAFRKTDAYRLAMWRDADGMYRLSEMVREADGSWREREHGQPDYFDVKQAQCTDILVEFWSP